MTGRPRVTLAMDVAAFRRIVLSRATFQRVADCYGVTRQAVNSWLALGRIPPRALANIAREFDLAPADVRAILQPQQPQRRSPNYGVKYRRLKKRVERLYHFMQKLEGTP